MSDINAKSRIRMDIADVMTSTIQTVFPDETVETAAKKMTEYHIGSIILRPKKEHQHPIGIVTERDIVTRVVALGKNPAEVTVDEIATRPVVTAPPTMDVAEAMSIMARLNIRRIVIVDENEIVGICTYRDLLRVAPSLIEIAIEYEKIGFGNRELVDEEDYSDYDEEAEFEDNPSSSLTMGYYCSECNDFCEEPPASGSIDEEPVCPECFESYKE